MDSKTAGQIILGCIISFWIFQLPEFSAISTKTTVPFLKNVEIDLGLFYPLMVIVVITGTSNAVNLTDGLDGLAAGLLAICFTVFSAIAYISGRIDFSNYLNILYLPEAGELAIFSSAMAGACIGYLWYNSHPAEVFMGDTGSLAIGGLVGIIALMIHQPFTLIIVGGIFVMEAGSVIVQVISFKTRGKRVFRMSPIHHHFELKGWPESRVVTRFWIIGILFALMSLTTFKVR